MQYVAEALSVPSVGRSLPRQLRSTLRRLDVWFADVISQCEVEDVDYCRGVILWRLCAYPQSSGPCHARFEALSDALTSGSTISSLSARSKMGRMLPRCSSLEALTVPSVAGSLPRQPRSIL